MEKLKTLLKQATEYAKTEKQKNALLKIIADIDNASVIEAYNAAAQHLVHADTSEIIANNNISTDIDELVNTMKLITGAAALWRELLGWSQSIGRGYVPLLSFDSERMLTVVCYTPHHLAMPTEEVAKAFGEKYKIELQKIYKLLTK